MYKLSRIFVMDLMNLITSPMWSISAAGLPLLLISALGFLTSGSYDGSITSYDYYGVALLIYGVFNTATFSANAFLEQKIKRPNLRIVYSPAPPFFITFSKTLATALFCIIALTVAAAVSMLGFGVNYGSENTWAVFTIMALAVLASSALGVTVCCVVKSEGVANQIVSLALTLASAFGGVFFPVDGLGKTCAVISNVSPARWILVTCFQIIYDADFTHFASLVISLLLLTLVLILLSGCLFKGEEYL